MLKKSSDIRGLNRRAFRKAFGTSGPVVLPVVHVLDTARTLRNVKLIAESGAPGCFLINHDFGVPPFLSIIRDVREAFPSLWMGINFLAVTGRDAFPQLAALEAEGCRIDAYWADDACIDELRRAQPEAEAIAAARGAWEGLYFGGTAFKKQRPVLPEDIPAAAKKACDWMDVVTTSGVATGRAADAAKISTFRKAVGDKPLALASGITAQNAVHYADVDCFMVATGINLKDNFYDVDPARLATLIQVAHELGEREPA